MNGRKCLLAFRIRVGFSLDFFLAFLQNELMEQPVTISPDIQSGTPVFFNTRVPIKNFFDYLSEGKNLDDFPSVTRL
jgi:uncharacterized protein (DUF433 family)